VSAVFGVGDAQPPRRSEPHEARWDAVERRDLIARSHPQIVFSARRDGGTLLYEVSAPDSAAAAYESAIDMVADLEKRHPARQRDPRPSPPGGGRGEPRERRTR
jgi:hypothetical protein